MINKVAVQIFFKKKKDKSQWEAIYLHLALHFTAIRCISQSQKTTT